MTDPTNPCHAVLLPGANYGPDGPLLMYAARAAAARGARVSSVSWQRRESEGSDVASGVAAQVAPVLDRLAAEVPGATPLLIGKSLGTCAATLAAERGLPAIWLTPLLTVDVVVDAMRRAMAPCLLVGGTADRLWDGPVARELSPHVLEVESADHGMFVPGPLAASADVLGRVATAVEGFLDDVVWPV